MLKTIGELAFNGCSKLSSINFTNCEFLTEIKGYAFNGCKQLTEIIHPKNLNELAGRVLQGTGITYLNIPNSVTRIGHYCCAYCGQLRTVNIEPESQLVYIGNVAFEGARISKIFIPKLVSSVEIRSLMPIGEIVVDPENQHFTSDDGILSCSNFFECSLS